MATNIAFVDEGCTDAPASKTPASPTKIWICVAGKEAPDWIVERMTTGEVAPNGSFEIEASDGWLIVEPGFAVFEAAERVFACPPRQVQEKLAAAAGETNPVVSELIEKTRAMREQRNGRRGDRNAPLAKAAGEKALKLKPMIGSPPSPQFALVEHLQVDDTYQRSIEGGASQKLIVKIAENWDWRLCLPLIVSRRQGRLYVIDGQHRLEAARLRGDIRDIPVVVFDFDDPRGEAELFVAANRSRRAMSKLDDFHAAIVAGDAKASAINEVVVEAGLVVGRIAAWQYWKPGEVVFVTAIQRTLHTMGKATVARSLKMIARAFDGLVLVGVGSVFEALCTLIRERDQSDSPIDDVLMEAVLAEVGIPGWKEAIDGSESGQERMERMLRAMAEAYAEAEAQ
ncbi:ParB/RepB/Spo0J family partition protein [Sphingomonas sp. DG1-23]|uniref:ParB/RepB/Spo0J family partition protein n=1 Tax=Sphingomonas sp. DG1-23 TaxID=3068316 RepID=UPI00273FAA64|nr:ParB/RepB/Spo0J family partition protein [Sphingomonas sp. DG1-23]MDP5279928.1 ParB/RepB/Spo0J family partition protein [Sphingomonas sp. DG1-23]